MTASPQRSYAPRHSAPQAIELLAVGCDATRLNQYVAALRNAGLPVHGEHAEAVSQLSGLLSSSPRDLILIDHRPDLEVETAPAAWESARKDSVILLLAADPGAHLDDVAALGARDILAPDDIERLVFTVHREYDTLLLRRALAATRKKLEEAEERSNALLESSRDAVAYVHEGMHVQANRSYAQLFGFDDATDLEGLPVMDLLAPDSRDNARGALREAEEGRAAKRIEVVFLSDDGRRLPASLECSPAAVDGEPCIQIVVRASGPRLAVVQGAVEQADKDALTGLQTSQAFRERLEQWLAGPLAPEGHATLALLSVSNFSQLLQNSGLPDAEALLRDTALAVLSRVGGNLLAAGRFSDHTLALLTESGSEPDELGRAWLSGLAEEVTARNQATCQPVYHLGLAVWDPAVFKASADWMQAVEQALERAGFDGADGLAVFGHLPDGVAGDAPAELGNLIEEALQEERLRLLFQPIVSLHGDAREHYAVLARLFDSTGTELSAEAIADQGAPAERVAEIDRWIIRNAISELAEQRKQGRKVVFFVPLSRSAVETDAILLWVCDCLREFQAKGAWLVFQFRESDLEASLEPARRLIEGLRKINCRIAVDRLTGSPQMMERLAQLEIDAVKLAPEFMDRLGEDQATQDRLREIHEQLARHELKTVATAVEDANSLAVLWNLGLHYIQGDFLQEPTTSLVTYEFEQ